MVKRTLLSVFASLLGIMILFAAQASAASRYKIGSGNTVTATPGVPRPNTTPCTVELFKDAEFDNFSPYDFQYTPPADCPGPWQKVVFTANIYVTKGIQYDRTANFWLGSTNIFFGTTAEPNPDLSPNWVVESDLTDYTPLFETAQAGQADIGNLVNNQYTGVIYASAELQFYPLEKGGSAPRPFDQVLPLTTTPGTVTLNSGTDMLAQTFSLPVNVEGAYLDVYAQSQNDDEFWYTCVPNNLSGELESCGNTAFRETEVTIDGQPAGVAPVYPWIFTGGIDPYLWFPLPGVQTLIFTPYRVNLTPFAGILSNGQPHTVSLSVFNADDYFSATATLLLYLDKNATQVTGEIIKNTLTAPNPQVQDKIVTHSNGDITGTVSVTSNRQFLISGYIEASGGKLKTTIQQSVDFSNVQAFDITSAAYVQDIEQVTSIETTTTQQTGKTTLVNTEQARYPLTVDINVVLNSNGTENQTTTVRQENYDNTSQLDNGVETSWQLLDNLENSTDDLEISGAGSIIGNSGQLSSQQYTLYNSTGYCYDETLTAASNKLTSFGNGCQ